MAEVLETQEQFPVQAGIQALNVIACGDTSTALMPLAARQRVTLLSRQESTQRNAHPVASPALRAGSLRSSLKPGAACCTGTYKCRGSAWMRVAANSPESKNDSGSNSARALLRLKLRCSASSDGGTATATTFGAIRFAHCAVCGLNTVPLDLGFTVTRNPELSPAVI